MRKFAQISPRIWQSKRFKGLASDDARLLFFGLLTSPHSHSAGCFRAPDQYVAVDLGWTVDALDKARAALIKADLIAFSAETSEYFIRDWLKVCPIQNAKHRTAVEKQIAAMECDAIRELVEAECEAACPRPVTPDNVTPLSASGGLMNTRLMRGTQA